jgi:hypothetical protein
MNTTDAVVARAMTTDSIHHTSAISPRALREFCQS